MGEELTPSQQAAAFHGLAINRAVPPDERLALALQALGLYETELNRWRPVVETARALQEAWVDEPGGTASDRFVAVEQAAEALTAALDRVPPSPAEAVDDQNLATPTAAEYHQMHDAALMYAAEVADLKAELDRERELVEANARAYNDALAEVERLRAVPTYEQAITHLRDHLAYLTWSQRCDEDRFVHLDEIDRAADYLSARLTEETTP